MRGVVGNVPFCLECIMIISFMFCLTDTKVFVKFLTLNIFVLTKTQQLNFINSHLGW